LAAIAALALMPRISQAQQPTADIGNLQKEAQNPVAGLISVPIQNNINFGIGPFGRNQNVLNIQPVIPVHPVGGSPWGMRLQLSLLYPKGPEIAKKK
jgi:hypothetical protein